MRERKRDAVAELAHRHAIGETEPNGVPALIPEGVGIALNSRATSGLEKRFIVATLA
jgi:hypothetical protein